MTDPRIARAQAQIAAMEATAKLREETIAELRTHIAVLEGKGGELGPVLSHHFGGEEARYLRNAIRPLLDTERHPHVRQVLYRLTDALEVC